MPRFRLGPQLAALLLAASSAQAGFRLVYERAVSSSNTVMEVVERPAGGYAIAAGSPMFLLQTDASGVVLSTTTYDADAAVSIDVTADGGLVLAGERLFPNDDYLVVRANAAGNVQWSQVYTAGAGGHGVHSIRELATGGFIATGEGWSGSFPPNSFVIVSRLASDGSSAWRSSSSDVVVAREDGDSAIAAASAKRCIPRPLSARPGTRLKRAGSVPTPRPE